MFVFHFLTSRLSLGAALRSDGPLLMSTGAGMVLGLSMWVVGIWGQSAKFSDAASPPPYTKSFFTQRLMQWIGSLSPLITGSLVAVAIVSAVMVARRRREPTDQYTMVSIWWLLPLGGALTVLVKTLPYYRFINATAAPIALAGLGAFVAVRFFLRLPGRARIAGVLLSLLVVGSLGWLFYDGLSNRWVSEQTQWATEGVRTSLASVHVVTDAAGERPNILVMDFDDGEDSTGTNVAYGWAKTYTNIYRTGLPGASARYSATYLGTLENFRKDEPTTSASGAEKYNEWSRNYLDDITARRAAYPADPRGVRDRSVLQGQRRRVRGRGERSPGWTRRVGSQGTSSVGPTPERDRGGERRRAGAAGLVRRSSGTAR